MPETIVRKIKTPTLYRLATIERIPPTPDPESDEVEDGAPEPSRTFRIAFSSEEPVDRWFGTEILDHSPGAANLEFFQSGRAPFLMDHDPGKQSGVIETASIDKDRKGRATVRLGTGEIGESAFRDIVVDGIRQNISVGYRIDKLVLDSQEGGREVYRAVSWTPVEASSVSIPADMTVGVGRAERDAPSEHETIIVKQQEERIEMPPETKPPEVELTQEQRDKLVNEKLALESKRVDEITALGARHNLRKLAEEHIRKQTSISEFRGIVLEQIGEGKELETPIADLGLGDKEIARYSIMRMVRAVVAVKETGGNIEKLAPFELECSRVIAEKAERAPKGFYVPFDVQRSGLWRDPRMMLGRDPSGFAMRAMSTSGQSDLVATLHLAGSLIEALRAEAIVMALGARTLSGLIGNVDIPRINTPATFGWIAEDAGSGDTALATGTVALSPKTVSGSVPITRRLLKQSSPDVELLVRSDLVIGAALAIDAAALNGSGAGNEPKGIRNQTGVGLASVAAAGDPTWAETVSFETDVAEANGLRGSLAYVTTPGVRGNMKAKEKSAGGASGRFVCENNQANGYDVLVSTQQPANGITFGNFMEVLIAFWGMLDINVDTATDAAKGGVVLRAFQDCDTNVRHAASFTIDN